MSRLLAVLLLTLVVAVALANAPDASGVEGTLEASVTVIGPEQYAYASSVRDSKLCLRAEAATGAPDGGSAILVHNGEINLVFGQPVVACTRLKIWVTSIGWGPAHYRVYVSADGKHWQEVGHLALDDQSEPGVFQGEFGTVNFVRVVRGGWALGALLVDAIRAEGGDAGK